MHEFACFYPSNTERGDEAMAANIAAGQTVTGLTIAHPFRQGS